VKAVVTGATGFVGGALTRRLLAEGWQVVALTRRATGLPSGTTHVAWSLGAVVPGGALEGADVVFHVAARVGDWGRPADFERENVGATAALLEASERARVGAFVFTSSPSGFLGDADVVAADESLEPPARALSAYGASKARADALVRAHRGVTRTVVLRPHAVLGPGERHLERLVRWFVRFGVVPRIGDGAPELSVTSLETCVEAHLRAAERSLGGLPSGRAYFVADTPALGLHALLSAEVTRRRGRPPRSITLRRDALQALARLAEWFHAPMPWWPPVINRYRVAMLSRSHSFCVERMVNELGVQPRDARAWLSVELPSVDARRARTSATTLPPSSGSTSASTSKRGSAGSRNIVTA
jgi:nucleoside-diphosphate-sugar epimerase